MTSDVIVLLDLPENAVKKRSICVFLSPANTEFVSIVSISMNVSAILDGLEPLAISTSTIAQSNHAITMEFA